MTDCIWSTVPFLSRGAMKSGLKGTRSALVSNTRTQLGVSSSTLRRRAKCALALRSTSSKEQIAAWTQKKTVREPSAAPWEAGAKAYSWKAPDTKKAARADTHAGTLHARNGVKMVRWKSPRTSMFHRRDQKSVGEVEAVSGSRKATIGRYPRVRSTVELASHAAVGLRVAIRLSVERKRQVGMSISKGWGVHGAQMHGRGR